MKWLKMFGALVVVVMALLALAPFFLRLNDYIPAIEKAVSARIGEPVSIHRLHVSIYPMPHARADDITIGSSDEIRVGKLTLTPDLWSFVRGERVIRVVELEDLTLAQKTLGALVALTHADRARDIRIEKIRLVNAVVKLEQSSFGPFDVEVQVSGARPGHLTLRTRDGALKAEVTPQGERYALDVSAQGWTPPLGPQIVFDELSVKGVARAKDADLSDVNAKLYGGSVSGKATVEWAKGVSVKGNLEVKRVELREALARFSPKTRLSGKLDAKPAFSAHAATTAQLGDELRIESPFAVHDGALSGFDLLAAATSLGKSPGAGGETRFSELSGRLLTERRTYRFSDLLIASGPFGARGAVTVSPSRVLSGQLSTRAEALGRVVSVPVRVGGTLDAPALYPDPRALAAAAAGTALLGPGVGTAAGAQLGKMVQEMLRNGGRKR